MPLNHDEKIKNKRAYYLYNKSCSCGERYGSCLNFYTDKPIDWSKSREEIEKFIKDAKLMCANCWAKLNNF